MKGKTCNQCLKQSLEEFFGWETMDGGWITLEACVTPKCPNYGLIQVPAEDMPEEVNDDKY